MSVSPAGPKSASANTHPMSPVVNAKGSPMASSTMVPASMRIVRISILIRSDDCLRGWRRLPAAVADVRQRLRQHERDADGEGALEEGGDGHVPGASARLHQLQRGNGELQRAVQEHGEVERAQDV